MLPHLHPLLKAARRVTHHKHLRRAGGRACVGIKIEAGSTVTEPVPSLEPGAWYSLSWLWCGDTFLGVEYGALQEPASLWGRLLTLLGPLSSKCSACPTTRDLTGRVDGVLANRAGRSCVVGMGWRWGRRVGAGNRGQA